MYPSTFSHINLSDEVPIGAGYPAQTTTVRKQRKRRGGTRRPRRRLAPGLARLAPGGGSSP